MEENTRIPYYIPEQGSLGLLALGAKGYEKWKGIESTFPDGNKKKPKWLIIGWDAADWDILNPLLAKGVMPALSRIITEGTTGRIATLNPPLSPLLWTSIATGRRAFEHGVLGFTERDPESNRIRAVRGSSRKVRTFWNILNESNLSSNVIGWWPSHPAEPVNGAMVSNFFQIVPKEGEDHLMADTIHPKEFISPLQKLRMHPSEVTGAIVAPFFPEAPGLRSAEDAKVRSVMKILAQTASIHNASTWLLEKKPSDLHAVYFDAIDHFCHLAMAYHPPRQGHIDPEDYRKYHYIVEAGYRFHDMMLERYMDMVGEDTNILLVSDHGFRSGKHRLPSLPEQPAAPSLDHMPYGVMAAWGPDVRQGELHGASLLDIFPTILMGFELPIPGDIPGRPLTEIFADPKEIGNVSTYERFPLSLPGEKGGIDSSVLEHLADIGYVDRNAIPKGDPSKPLPENRVNLSRSFADGGRWDEALDEIRSVASEFPSEPWILEEWGMLSWKAGSVKDLEEVIQKMEPLVPDSRWLTFFKGVRALILGRTSVARRYLNDLPEDPMVRKLIARAWLSEGGIEEARDLLETLAEDEEVCFLLGSIHFEKGDWESALNQLLESIRFRFAQPDTHYLLSRTLKKLDQHREALQAIDVALKYRPGRTDFLEWRRSLAPVGVPDKLPLVWVVTGLPRSGTSLMMQIMERSGIDPLTDEQRAPDPHNPDGYFEWEAIRQLPFRPELVEEAAGKVVKVVIPYCRFLPPTLRYKVILMERGVQDVVRSQERMKGKVGDDFPLQIAMDLERERDRTKKWLDDQPHINWISIPYEDLIGHDPVVIDMISDFVPGSDPEHWIPIIRKG